jgi:hypothetical protein
MFIYKFEKWWVIERHSFIIAKALTLAYALDLAFLIVSREKNLSVV